MFNFYVLLLYFPRLILLAIFCQVDVVVLVGNVVEYTILAAVYDAWEFVEHRDVMGCHHYSCALLGDILEQSHDVAGGLWVEISRRLIGDDDFRIVEQGTGDGHTLLFST